MGMFQPDIWPCRSHIMGHVSVRARSWDMSQPDWWAVFPPDSRACLSPILVDVSAPSWGMSQPACVHTRGWLSPQMCACLSPNRGVRGDRGHLSYRMCACLVFVSIPVFVSHVRLWYPTHRPLSCPLAPCRRQCQRLPFALFLCHRLRCVWSAAFPCLRGHTNPCLRGHTKPLDIFLLQVRQQHEVLIGFELLI